jgi:hypothetical protein
MILPGLALLFAFTFVPLAYSVIAFQKFNPALGVQGSPWVGLDNILYMFSLRDARQVFFNTVFIATMKMACRARRRRRFCPAAQRSALPAHPALDPDDGLPAALPFVGDPGGNPAHDPGARWHGQ